MGTVAVKTDICSRACLDVTVNGGVCLFHGMTLQAKRARFCLYSFYFFSFQDMTLPALFFCVRLMREFPEQTGFFGGMGTVAGKADSTFYGRHIMESGNLCFLMTAKAELFRGPAQKLRIFTTMGLMTGKAPLFKRRMKALADN